MWLVDERFVPAADERRNDEAAWDGFLSRAPGVEFVRMPTSDRSSPGAGCLKAAADAFAATWATLMGERSFDIALIGMGPDGHVCSLFPGRYDAHERRRIIAVDDSPKPPAKRISVSMPVMTQCREVWLTTSGASKADALARAFGGASPHEVPVAALLSAKTRVYVDAAAASGFAHS